MEQVRFAISHLVSSFDAITQLKRMERLQHYSLTEGQFAKLKGRCRMYQHLPAGLKQRIPEMQFGDAQINAVCRDYYRDQSFCRNSARTAGAGWVQYFLWSSVWVVVLTLLRKDYDKWAGVAACPLYHCICTLIQRMNLEKKR